MNIKQLIIGACSILIIAGSITSCNRIKTYIARLESKTANKPLARVGSTYLYRKDIPPIVQEGTSPQDSIAIINKYVDLWAIRQLVLSEAQKSISVTDLTKEVEEFKELLLQGKYEQAVISEKLDTVITKKQIKEYYNQNTQNLTLSKDIILWSYLPITYCENDLERKLRSAFSRDSAPKNRKKHDKDQQDTSSEWTWEGSIEEIMASENYNAPFVKDKWIEVDKIMGSYETDKGFARDVAENPLYTFTIRKNDNVYLCKALRFMRQGNIAPLEYVEPQIRSIILNRRKVEAIKQAQEELKAEAIKNNNLEIFTDNEDN